MTRHGYLGEDDEGFERGERERDRDFMLRDRDRFGRFVGALALSGKIPRSLFALLPGAGFSRRSPGPGQLLQLTTRLVSLRSAWKLTLVPF